VQGDPIENDPGGSGIQQFGFGARGVPEVIATQYGEGRERSGSGEGADEFAKDAGRERPKKMRGGRRCAQRRSIVPKVKRSPTG